MILLVHAFVVLACLFPSALLGLFLRNVFPPHYLQEDSIGVVRLGTGIIGTLTALVLGLLLASAKGNYDRVNDQVTNAAAAYVLLDRTLAEYGPQTKESRRLLRISLASAFNRIFSEHGDGATGLVDAQRIAPVERLQDELRKLIPENDTQRTLQAHALELSNELVKLRLLTITQTEGSIPVLLFVVLVFSLAIMFAGFGLMTSKNPMVIVVFSLCSVICWRGFYDRRTDSTV